ncbi:MAG TPA: ABC transporter permease subunit [Candidatus Binatia bacterium]|nr:ABC transporter permease subunit [Candidatus Binatia bacterium]
MTANATPAPAAAPATTAPSSTTAFRMPRRPGWMTIAGKELSDHVLSIRFYVLMIVLGIAALIPLYFAADRIRALAPAVSGAPAVFLAMFVLGPDADTGPIPFTVQGFVAMTAPLLGVAFAFDSVNGERHQGTLPRLLSQPIHRDDVINGKFAAGLAIITLGLTAVVLVVAGFGMLRLAIMPTPDELIRLILWFGVTLLYVGLWLAFGLLLSVVIRRAATSALVGFGVWLFLAIPIAGPLLVRLLGAFLASGATTASEYYGTIQWVQRLLPGQLYAEATTALLSPGTTSVSASDVYSVNALPSQSTLLTFDQSLLLIWPQLVILFALMVGCFALAYVRFMRQEVRA